MQIPGGMIDVKESAGNLTADLSLFCLVLNDHGIEVTRFKERIPKSVPLASGRVTVLPNLVHNQVAKLAARLYQVRVVARDNLSGLTGAAQEWIEIPNLASNRITLSTPFIGEYPGSEIVADPASFKDLSLNINRHFSINSNLRFMAFVYNAAGAPTSGQTGTPANIVGDAKDEVHTTDQALEGISP